MRIETINFNEFLDGSWNVISDSKIKTNWIKFLSITPYPVTSKFLQKESFRNSGHSGIDFSMPKDTPLRSIQDGTVYKIVDYGNVNAGKTVMIKWEDGRIAIYGHLNKFANIKEGDSISVGEVIGYSGNSGHVVGANGGYHLHFGLKEGNDYIDPSPFIEHIQNMNNLEKLYALTNHSTGKTFTFNELLQNPSSIYENIFNSLEMYLINLDYSVFIHNFQHLLQFFPS